MKVCYDDGEEMLEELWFFIFLVEVQELSLLEGSHDLFVDLY